MDNKLLLTPAQRSFLASFLTGFDDQGWSITLAGQAGSQRLFYRIAHPDDSRRSYILIVWDGNDEDWPRFLAIPRELGTHLGVFPRIHCSDPRHGLILEEDLGRETLKAFCDRSAGRPGDLLDVYQNVLDILARWQQLDTRLSPTISSRMLDYETFMWESDYFARRCVVDFCGAERLLTPAWEREREALAREVGGLPKCFVHRDFQSENIMLADGGIKFVDFQGARLGPPAYDVASLLYDPYMTALDDGCVEGLFDYYCARAPGAGADRRSFDICAAQRLMQALGAYGNLSIHQGKPRYRAFVPVALSRLCRVLRRLPDYPAARSVAERCRELVSQSASR